MAFATDGYISGYSVALGGLAANQIHLLGNPEDGVNEEKNAPLRFQYSVTVPEDGTAKQTQPIIVGKLTFKVFPEDKDTWNNSRDFGVSMFVVKASEFPRGKIPTSAQLRAAKGVRVWRSKEILTNAQINGEEQTLTVRGPSARQLQPNTKYWVMLMASAWVRGSEPSTKNDKSASGPQETGINVSRGLSMWTNRTPKAPEIILPVSGSTFDANTSVPFQFQSGDRDAISGGGEFDRNDVAGIQVQYAPRATPTKSDVEWRDMPWAETQFWVDTHGSQRLGKGWYMHRSIDHKDRVHNRDIDTGIKNLWTDSTSFIRVGSRAITNGQGVLPAGDWQLRMRTFDYGHPFPNDAAPFGAPLNAAGRARVNPTMAPAVNTSEWSDIVTITVLAQVPAPIPLSPVDEVAVMDGQDVEFSFQYLNTARPPFPQASFRIQIRKVTRYGEEDEAWTTIADEDSALTKFTLASDAAYTLVSGNHYEWRVSATDTDGYESEWCDPARFWCVPTYDTGPIKPVSDETNPEVTLGVGKHRAFIFRRGGKVRIGEVTGIVSLDWERKRDEISTAEVVVMDWSVDCGNLLARLEPWAYELVLYRTVDTKHGPVTERVWEGPITALTYEVDKVTIDAKDPMAYLYRRAVHQKMNDKKRTVTDRAMRVIQNCFAPDDPNVLAYFRPLFRDDDAIQYRSLPPYSRTGYEEVDDMASNAGLDYTCVGRSIIVWGTKHRIGTLPEFLDKHLGNAPIVSVYGMQFADRYIISDGNGVFGMAERLDENGEDPDHGLVEMLSSTWSSEADDEEGIYTAEGLEKVRKSFTEQAERSISDRNPVPLIVRIPDNTSLQPDTPISIQDLVPGVVIPLRSTKTLRKVAVSQKLDAIKVTQSGDNEVIAITMGAFTRDDASTEEEAVE